METKRCCTCQELLPFEMFGKNKSQKYGITKQCKKCRGKYLKKNQDKIIAKRKKYRSDNKARISASNKVYCLANKDAIKKHLKIYVKNHTEEQRARAHFGHKIRIGEIIRPSACSGCGKPCKPEGHHWDYSKPLDVIWLCSSCHKQLHAKLNREAKKHPLTSVNPPAIIEPHPHRME